MLLTILASISQFERECIKERQKEGIDLKKAKGGYKGRIPIRIDEKLFEEQYKAWKSKLVTAKSVRETLKLKPNTFYRRVRDWEAEHGQYNPKYDRYYKEED